MVPRIWRTLPYLSLLLAVAAVVLLGLGPLGWRVGWWHFRLAFQFFMPAAAYCGIVAVCLALIGFIFGTRRPNAARHGWVCMLAFVVGAAIAYIPWHYDQLRRSVPPIHDITTDWQNPPQFRAIVPLREAQHANPVAYEGAKVSDLQRHAYPDIRPVETTMPTADAFVRALKTAERMGWTIVASDPEARVIEASERSRWFGFVDDIVIRITPTDSGSRIDIRSVSRVGRSDFGVNAARVRHYLAALRDTAEH